MAKSQPADNWKHRAANMQCQTCMSFVPKIALVANASSPVIGRCRRMAPTMRGFPVVFESDWCGEHKLDENKI
jgi:hypothetical protein